MLHNSRKPLRWILPAILLFAPRLSISQVIGNGMPVTKSAFYVVIPASGLVANLVKTKRARAGKSEYIDLVNVQVDAEPFMLQAGTISGLNLNGPADGDKLLITMVLLPDKVTGLVVWEPVLVDSLKTRRREFGEVVKDCYARLVAYKSQQPYVNSITRRLDLRPVIFKEGQYWTTHNTVLTEYFLVRSQPLWFATNTDNVTVNYNAQPLPRNEYRALKKQLIARFPVKQDRPIVEGELQNKILLDNKAAGVFSFWSIPPRVTDADITCFGAVDFKFKPDVGLLSGKYPDYFNLSWDNAANTFFETISVQSLSK